MAAFGFHPLSPAAWELFRDCRCFPQGQRSWSGGSCGPSCSCPGVLRLRACLGEHIQPRGLLSLSCLSCSSGRTQLCGRRQSPQPSLGRAPAPCRQRSCCGVSLAPAPRAFLNCPHNHQCPEHPTAGTAPAGLPDPPAAKQPPLAPAHWSLQPPDFPAENHDFPPARDCGRSRVCWFSHPAGLTFPVNSAHASAPTSLTRSLTEFGKTLRQVCADF